MVATGGNRAIVSHLMATRDALVWTLRQPMDDRPLLNNDIAVMEYLRVVQGFARMEIVRTLYLDTGNRLLRDEVAARGTVDEAPIYVREIIHRALELGATGLILAHNHPSGDTTPSMADREVTRTLALAGRPLGIRLLDHILVSRSDAISFRALGYI